MVHHWLSNIGRRDTMSCKQLARGRQVCTKRRSLGADHAPQDSRFLLLQPLQQVRQVVESMAQ
jgi:hypothetical protein